MAGSDRIKPTNILYFVQYFKGGGREQGRKKHIIVDVFDYLSATISKPSFCQVKKSATLNIKSESVITSKKTPMQLPASDH